MKFLFSSRLLDDMNPLVRFFVLLFSDKSMRYVGAQVVGIFVLGVPASNFLSLRPGVENLFVPVLAVSLALGIGVYMAYRIYRYDVDLGEEIKIALISLLVYPLTSLALAAYLILTGRATA